MKTRTIKIYYCSNKKCKFNIGTECVTTPEIDNHKNCLSCTNKTSFKIKQP